MGLSQVVGLRLAAEQGSIGKLISRNRKHRAHGRLGMATIHMVASTRRHYRQLCHVFLDLGVEY